MYDCQMNEERKIMEEVSGKLGNGHNNRRYKVATNKDMRPSYLIENELKRLADLSKRIIAIVTKGALESPHFLLTVQVLTSIERYQKLIVVLSEPNLLEQLQIRCEPLALQIKNHSSVSPHLKIICISHKNVNTSTEMVRRVVHLLIFFITCHWSLMVHTNAAYNGALIGCILVFSEILF